MSEFRTMSLPSVMLFVSMKMSSGVVAAAGGGGRGERQRPLHCAASLGRSADGSPSFVMLTGGDLRGTTGKEGLRPAPPSCLAPALRQPALATLGTESRGHFMVFNSLNPR